MSRFGAMPVDAARGPRVSRFGALAIQPPATTEPRNLREFIGEEKAAGMTAEQAIAGGYVDEFAEFLREKAEKLEPDSPERQELAKHIAGLRSDAGAFRAREAEAAKRGVSPETVDRLNSPVGAAEQAISQTAAGQTLMRAEQGLSNIAETGLSMASRANPFGSGKLSAAIHRDKALRDEFLTKAEQGGQIESLLGESGSRVYNSVVGSVAKFSVAGMAGPAAVYSLIAGESFDDGLEEAKQNGMEGKNAVAYASSKAVVETGLTFLMGKVGKRLGLATFEETLSPGMRAAAAKLAGPTIGKRLAREAASAGLEVTEETLIDAVQQGVELYAGTSRKFDWRRLLEAGAAGAVSRGATGAVGALESLRKIPAAKIEETVKGVTAAEQALGIRSALEQAESAGREPGSGGRGARQAKRFFETATPEIIAEARKPLSQKDFARVTGLKKTSKVFRDTFRETLDLYAGTLSVPTETGKPAPDAAPVASEGLPPTTESDSAGAPQTAATEPVEAAPENPGEITATRQANIEQDREILDLLEVAKPDRLGFQQALETARVNNVPRRAVEIARKLKAEPRALSPVESAGMTLRLAEIKNEYDAARAAMDGAEDGSFAAQNAAAELDRLQQEFDEISEAEYTSGSLRGQALAHQKFALNKSYDVVSLYSRAKRAKQGEAPTSRERHTLESLARKLDELESQIATHKGDAAEFDKLVFERDRTKREIDYKIRDLKPKNLWHHTKHAADLSRNLITSGEMSAVLRQGSFIVFGRPILASKSVVPMFKAAFDPVYADKVNREIQERPNARMYAAAKLYLHDENANLSQREEAYADTWLTRSPSAEEKRSLLMLPATIARAGVQASARAYTTFLNKLRADTFDLLYNTLTKDGNATLTEARAIANYVNVATGRGGIAKFDRAISESATVFFAPRYVVSRFQLVTGQPLYGGTMRTRKMIAGEYARYLIGLSAFYALADLAFGDEEGFSLNFDPRSSDFGKLNFNGTRIDPLGGLSQATVFIARTITGESASPSGKITKLRGEKARGSWANTAGRFLRTKLNPVVGTGIDIAAGENVIGEPVTPEGLFVGSVLPLTYRDVWEAMEQQGVPRGAAMSTAAFFGMGLQTYQSH